MDETYADTVTDAIRDCPGCYGGLLHDDDDDLTVICPRCHGIGLVGPGE